MKKIVFGSLAMVFLMVFAGVAGADQKNYVWTYDYSSLAKDSAEIEFYQTAVTRDRKVSSRSDWQQQIELEYGITDHLDAALYEMYERPVGGTFDYAGYKFRLRYRIAEKNQLPLDVVLYAEHQENVIEPNAFEGKLIFAKDIGKVNIAYNQIYERQYSPGVGAHEYAGGVSYEVLPFLRLGAESKGSYKKGEYAVGPTIAWVGGRIWANIGAVFSLNDKTNDREVRFLLGVPF